MDDLRANRGYRKLKEDALYRTMWSSLGKKTFSLVVRQTEG